MEYKDRLGIRATMVANTFIDTYMAAANGEYVKVYLYLLRNQETATISSIADALEHTEADVSRAISYWVKQGVLSSDAENVKKQADSAESSAPAETHTTEKHTTEKHTTEKHTTEKHTAKKHTTETPQIRETYTTDQINQLASNEEFAQLLYIAQKYLKKVFTPRDSEVFAYLYDKLHMSAELLEYLVEYCALNAHTSLRYIETVALNWHGQGLLTVDAAEAYASGFGRDTFAIMKAFGLNDRKPASSERELIDRWFKSYGFTKELVLEACNRTMEAIHKPSFQYADKILTEWQKSGVRRFADVEALDKKRSSRSPSGTVKPAAKSTAKNQFHNFSQRDTDYDAIVLEQWKEQ